MFNYMYSMPSVQYRGYLRSGTHHEFMKAWDTVKHGYEKPGAMDS